MVLSTLVAAAAVWVKTNVVALVAGFVARHVSPAFVAKVKALWASIKAKL